MPARTLRRAGLVLAGLILGLLLVAIGLGVYLRAAQVRQAQSAISARLNLPEDVLRVEDVSAEGSLRIALRSLAVLDERGDTIVSAPVARMRLDAASLAGDGPIVFEDVELRDPYARLVQGEDGEWNVIGAMRVEADGNELAVGGEEDAGRPILLRDVRVVDGRLLLALPATEPDTAGFASRLNLPLTRIGGAWYQMYAFGDLDASLPAVRVGGTQGWRAEIASLDARLVEPDLRISGMAGFAEAVGEDGVRFELRTLRFGESRLAAEGTVRFPVEEGEGLVYDVQAQVERLAFSDLAALIPSVPAGGTARFGLDVETRPDGRTALRVADLQLVALESRLAGRLGVVVGGEGAPAFMDTDLELDPLRLAALEQLGLVEETPFLGTVRGTLVTAEPAAAGGEGALKVDLTASVVPRDQPDAEPSVVVAVGDLAAGDGETPLRMTGLRVQLQPLHLSSLASLLPEQRERLRGEVRGMVTLSGTPGDLVAEGGELLYEVGDAAPTRLAGITGSVSLDPVLRYSLRASAQPLALASLTELFPALPFRTASLSGPIEVEGGEDQVRFGVDLSGNAGAIRVAGSAQLGTPLRFDVEGRVETFTPSAVLRGELPVEGAVTGTFAARGTAEDFAFNADLAQTAGSFALSGRVRLPGGAPVFEVGGQVQNFRLGALIGQPGLFSSPLSGTVRLDGGGEEAYRFDVDLRGDVGVLDLEGSFDPGEVPSYRAAGEVAGLDLRRLPISLPLPATSLTARLDLRGSGTTLETLAGSLAFDARRSTVGGVALDVARGSLEVRDGILRVDTVAVELLDTRFRAEGQWGLTQPAPEPLEFAFESPDLGILSRMISTPQLVQPQIAGALRVEGTVAGSARYPVIVAGARGRRLRYEQWQAGALTLALEAARTAAVGWGGEASLNADALELAGGQTLQSIGMRLDGNQSALAVGLSAQRDGESDVSVSGIVEFEGQIPRGVVLDSLGLRIADTRWALQDQARIRWGGVDGVRVENLALRRGGDTEGSIRVDGQLPPTGNASLSVQANGVNLADARQLLGGSTPEMAGRLSLDVLLEGPVASPDFTLQARVDSLQFQELRAEMVSIRGEYGEQRLQANAEVWVRGRQVARVEAGIPMLLSVNDLLPGFQLLREAPLAARIRADSLPVQLFTAVIPQLENGEGFATASVDVEGTIDAPRLEGAARLRQASVGVVPLGVTYSAIDGRVTLEGNTVRIDALTARSRGTAVLDGSIRFEPGTGPLVSLTADLAGFRAMDVEDLATVTVSGRAAVSGNLPGPVLTGQLSLLETTIAIPDLEDRSSVEITDVEVGQVGTDSLAAAGILPPLLSDLRIEALEVEVDESVMLVSDEARIQIAGDLVLYRTGEDLRVFGLLQAVRGTYALEVGSIVREFDIVSGRVQFFGTGDLNPSLQIVAANTVRTGGTGTGEEITVLVNISGTLLTPRIALSSDTPTPLSETELFSLLIFGRPSFELGGLGTTAFAQQIFVQELLGGILATELERPILASGLCDYVRVQPGSLLPAQGGDFLNTLNTAAIECGKEITDELFVTVETGLGAILAGDALGGGSSGFDWGVGLEWQIDREWMWELTYGPVRRGPLLRLVSPLTKYQLSTDLRRRWEYGKPSGPSALETAPADSLPGEVRR